MAYLRYLTENKQYNKLPHRNSLMISTNSTISTTFAETRLDILKIINNFQPMNIILITDETLLGSLRKHI